MSMRDEFKAFIMKGNVVDLAIAVVVGSAFGKIITAFVDGIVMPLVTIVLPANIKWEEWVLGKFRIGAVLGATVNFLIIALVIFLVLIKFLGKFVKKEVAAPTTKECPACLEQVPLKATRCKYCTSQL
ncbi:large conductance mechanosensitive channel protein MscL [Geothrix fuzhouensis]|uniref:large conductance mechanosensitive channel protein MscL n=1 Tax=Geothrix fuzhouensis TaxID=2966451 RepID=UPI002148CF08|nr:large conductance mechanosensitive channel protein MscL [Geothrix fuzhouensis]